MDVTVVQPRLKRRRELRIDTQFRAAIVSRTDILPSIEILGCADRDERIVELAVEDRTEQPGPPEPSAAADFETGRPFGIEARIAIRSS
nr:hypothetical protein [Aurantiacibacter atlanticus]